MQGDRLSKSAAAVRSRWIVLAAAIAVLMLGPASATADDAGFKNIFNGKNLDGWDGDPRFWSVQDGEIVGQTTAENPAKGNTFLIWRQAPVDDFELRVTYKLSNHNSGIQYRSKEVEKWVVAGYQADFEGGDTYSGLLYEERGRGILAPRAKKVVIHEDGTKEETTIGDSKELQDNIKKGDWNEYVIIARGNHLIHRINGKTTAECIDEQTDKRALSGILALQLHAGPPMKVQFKNLQLKRTKLSAVEPGRERKKIVMVAGAPSHGVGEHEFNAGTLLLEKCLNRLPQIATVAYLGGWPKDPTAFDNADTVVLYMNGGNKHPILKGNRLAQFERMIAGGAGLCCLHYAVEVPKESGGPEFLRWIGGYYETGYSINPTWTAHFDNLPKHAIASGVGLFGIEDEWYYNIRFREGASGVQPLLKAVPPDDTRRTEAAKALPGRSEILAWAVERSDGGRGFGFTGGHFHKNWGHDDVRKLVLNAILWTAKLDVPREGMDSVVTPQELAQNLDPKPKKSQ